MSNPLNDWLKQTKEYLPDPKPEPKNGHTVDMMYIDEPDNLEIDVERMRAFSERVHRAAKKAMKRMLQQGD